jgi:hypothetical protein
MSRKNMSLTKFGIDDGPHNMDGLRLLGGTELNGSKRSSAAR